MEKYPRDLLERLFVSSGGSDNSNIHRRTTTTTTTISQMQQQIQNTHHHHNQYHQYLPSSLPTETEEEWRKRKELQTLRRLEAKRRRPEKQRVSKSEKDSSAATTEEIEVGGVTMGLTRSTVGAPIGLPNWAMATKQVVLGDVLGKGKIGIGFQGLFAQPSSQGSVDSQGGSSSSVSEMDSKPFLGSVVYF
ncbi:hypothetical protein TSUD_219290 [Trifolium subterraneum]|uniref:Ninja-family protein n=1 Tax=Trifolium subterraneum TaxID=3900 RepID=A0A2Z6NF64_TRISU|nr:hypothetical protein TSUD_219290 [Trifolium subterraneum]